MPWWAWFIAGMWIGAALAALIVGLLLTHPGAIEDEP